jgi:hypothetical protein
MITFPGVHSSAVQGYSFFLDLLSSPSEEDVWDILHEEVQSISLVIKEYGQSKILSEQFSWTAQSNKAFVSMGSALLHQLERYVGTS